MLLRLIIRLFLGWAIGNPDTIEQDRKPWPTWLVATLMLLIIGAIIAGYFLLASSAKH